MSVRWDGLFELQEALRRLPTDLAADAGPIVIEAANDAAAEITAAYPERTGDLRNGVHVRVLSGGPFGAAAEVVNRAPHAYMFENGTVARHTEIGANRGSMPAGHVFIPRIIRHRRQMYADLKAMIARHGLEVTGDA